MKSNAKKPTSVLTPVLTPQVSIITPTVVPESNSGACIICQVDSQGNEIPDTDFTSSMRVWDKTFSKSTNPTFKLKKK